MMETILAWGLLGLLLMLFMVLVPVFAVVLWVWMLVDCIQRTFKDKADKVDWIVVIVFTHVIGAVIYFFLVKRKG